MWSFSKKSGGACAPPLLFFILTYQKVDCLIATFCMSKIASICGICNPIFINFPRLPEKAPTVLPASRSFQKVYVLIFLSSRYGVKNGCLPVLASVLMQVDIDGCVGIFGKGESYAAILPACHPSALRRGDGEPVQCANPHVGKPRETVGLQSYGN